MALIKCPECGREKVSDSAESCPECGFGIKAYIEEMSLEKEKQVIPKLYDEDDIIQIEGSFSLVKNNKTDYSLFYSVDVIEEQVSMEFNIDYSVKYNEDIQKVETTDAVDINNLSDADTNKILTNISENENINKFVEDISAIFSYITTGDEDYLA